MKNNIDCDCFINNLQSRVPQNVATISPHVATHTHIAHQLYKKGALLLLAYCTHRKQGEVT